MVTFYVTAQFINFNLFFNCRTISSLGVDIHKMISQMTWLIRASIGTLRLKKAHILQTIFYSVGLVFGCQCHEILFQGTQSKIWHNWFMFSDIWVKNINWCGKMALKKFARISAHIAGPNIQYTHFSITLYEECCARSSIQGPGQVIVYHRFCGM